MDKAISIANALSQDQDFQKYLRNNSDVSLTAAIHSHMVELPHQHPVKTWYFKAKTSELNRLYWNTIRQGI